MVSDPDEIMIDDIERLRKMETYTIVHLPADCDGNTNASVQVKVNTGEVLMPCPLGCLKAYSLYR